MLRNRMMRATALLALLLGCEIDGELLEKLSRKEGPPTQQPKEKPKEEDPRVRDNETEKKIKDILDKFKSRPRRDNPNKSPSPEGSQEPGDRQNPQDGPDSQQDGQGGPSDGPQSDDQQESPQPPTPPESPQQHGGENEQQPSEVETRDTVINQIKVRHLGRLDAASLHISEEARAEVRREMILAAETLREISEYYEVQYQLQRLAWLDLLLSTKEIAGLRMVDVLESMIARGKLADFLHHYAWGYDAWAWFHANEMNFAMLDPDEIPLYGSFESLTYASKEPYFDILKSDFSDWEIWFDAGKRMEERLARRTKQLIARDPEIVEWLRSLGFAEVANALPPPAQPRGENRIEMMKNYLTSITTTRHHEQLRWLVPPLPAEDLVTTMLLFSAGAKDTSYPLDSVGELVDIKEAVERNGGQLEGDDQEFWVDRNYYEVIKSLIEGPSEDRANFYQRQFAR